MPWTYLYLRKSDAFVATAWGVVSSDDLITGLRKLRSEPTFHKDARRFGDYANVEKFELSTKFLSDYEQLEASHPASGKYAILQLLPSGSSQFQKYLNESSSGPLRVFGSRLEAIDWLNEGAPLKRQLTYQATMLAHRHIPRPASLGYLQGGSLGEMYMCTTETRDAVIS